MKGKRGYLSDILEAVRATSNQTHAAANLGCSEAYVRNQIKLAGLTLAQVLDAEDVVELVPIPREKSSPCRSGIMRSPGSGNRAGDNCVLINQPVP